MINILYIEDEVTDQMLFKRIIKKCDFDSSVNVLENLIDVTPDVLSEEIDIIFCDFNLRDGTALDFLKSNDSLSIPVIILTSQAELKRAISALKLGATDFMQKNELSVETLTRSVNNVLRIIEDRAIREKLEKELETSYSNTNSILENTSDGIWSLNKQGEIIVINRVAKKRFESNFEFLPKPGDKLFELIDSKIATLWEAIFKRSLLGKPITSIDEYSTLTGTFYLEVICTPTYENEKVIGATFFARDITEREKSEKRIRESERNFRSVFEGSEIPILIERLSDHVIVDLNKSGADLHNYSIAEMVGMSIFDTIPPEYVEESQKKYVQYLTGELDQLDGFVYTSDRKSIPVNITVNKIQYNNEKCNLIFLHDISVRIETEKKLESAKIQAEKNAQFKSNFLANMSHEIRTPMNAMMGFTQLLKETGLKKEQDKYVDIISKSGDDLLVIINDILDLSKIQARKLEIRNKSFEFKTLFTDILLLHEKKAEHKKLYLNLDYDQNIPSWLVGDEARLKQIVNNLVSNAIKFTSEGGVDIKVVLQNTEDNLCSIRIEVEDTGIGIPVNKMKTVFEDFAQIDSSLQRKAQGTGLGLAISQNLCELMHGKIGLEQNASNGSTFYVEIPFETGSEIVETKKSLKSAASLKGLNVLVCEDNELNSLLVKKVLDSIGAIPTFCINGLEGVKSVKEIEPDIILMDIQMPIMDGYEASQQIRAFSEVPIIAMSAHVMVEERQKCLDAGMNGFIKKPFKLTDIIESLDDEFSKKTTSEKNNGLNMPSLSKLADGDEEFIKTVLDTFLENTPVELTKLKEAIDNNDNLTIVHIAHKLRSSFQMLELRDLYGLSLRIEKNECDSQEIGSFERQLSKSIEKITEIRQNL